jgi:hypothetical protein
MGWDKRRKVFIIRRRIKKERKKKVSIFISEVRLLRELGLYSGNL